MINLSSEEAYCNRCSISFFPEQDDMRTANRVSMPKTPEENPPLVSTKVPDPNEAFLNKGKAEPQGGLKALQDKGLKITSITETGGDGRPLKRNRWA